MTKYEDFLKNTELCALSNIDRAFKEQSYARMCLYIHTFQGHLLKEMDKMNPLEFELWEEKIKAFLNIRVDRKGRT
jgi:hypothetical protein